MNTPTPEELAEFSLAEIADLDSRVVRELTSAHYEALSPKQILKLYPLTKIGPTWSGVAPERSLAWGEDGIVKWCTENLLSKEGGKWEFTAEQVRHLAHWYAVNESGEFINRKGALIRLKGWGKDPYLAVLCLIELVGPSRFSHWDKDGQPVGKPHPAAWVQVVAVSRDQTRNTMTVFPSLMSDAFKAKYQVDAGIELIRAQGGKVRLEAVTSSYRSLEGGRTTFTVLNEVQHWTRGNGGVDTFGSVTGNATKTNSRWIAIANAHVPGEDSVGERLRTEYERTRDGLAYDSGLMYDTLEAHAATPLIAPVLAAVIEKVRGDAIWLDIPGVIAEVMSLSISMSESRRKWLNQVVAQEDALYGPEQWDVLADPSANLEAGDEIVLGFDGGKTDDSTALVAIRVHDRTAFPLGLWEKPAGAAGEGWHVDTEAVSRQVDEAFALYSVQGFYADVAFWESFIAQWERDHGESLAVKSPSGKGPIGWDMRGSLKVTTLAHERLMSDIFEGKVRHNGDRLLRRHVLNARRASNSHGWGFRKESRDSPKKIDMYAALFLAFECLYDLTTKAKPKTKRTGNAYFIG